MIVVAGLHRGPLRLLAVRPSSVLSPPGRRWRGLQRKVRSAHRAAGRALHVGRVQQLSARRPLAVRRVRRERRRSDVDPLAFHVDYWDRLGWKDRFAAAAFTERQYDAMRANRARFVYTPQVLVQGRDFPEWRERGGAAALATTGARPPRRDYSRGGAAAGIDRRQGDRARVRERRSP